MTDDIVIDALKKEITELKAKLEWARKDRDDYKDTADYWRTAWEQERRENARLDERMDKAITAIYDFVGLPYD